MQPCSICFEEFTEQDVDLIGCGNRHWLHGHCFGAMAAISRKTACPLCRDSMLCPDCGSAMTRMLCMRCYTSMLLDDVLAKKRADQCDDLSPCTAWTHCKWMVMSLFLMRWVDKDIFPSCHLLHELIAVINFLLALDGLLSQIPRGSSFFRLAALVVSAVLLAAACPL